jgi:hypothetical protein
MLLVVAKMILPLHTIDAKDRSENIHVNPVHLFTSSLVCVSKMITGSFFHGDSF